MPSVASAVSTSSPTTPVPKKKGRPKLITNTPSTTPASVIQSVGTTPQTSFTVHKARFPSNPMLKKKLLGLQKYLSEFTVSKNGVVEKM